MAKYFYFGLSTTAFEVTAISVVKFLITCLVSKLKDKDNSHPPSWILKKSMTSPQGKIVFLQKQLANIFDVKIHLDSYAYTSYVNRKVFKKISLRFN